MTEEELEKKRAQAKADQRILDEWLNAIAVDLQADSAFVLVNRKSHTTEAGQHYETMVGISPPKDGSLRNTRNFTRMVCLSVDHLMQKLSRGRIGIVIHDRQEGTYQPVDDIVAEVIEVQPFVKPTKGGR